jgi:hypothetical protein
LPLRGRGIAIADGGPDAYFLPRKTGVLCKIALSAEEPAVVATGAKDPDLRLSVAAVSEPAKSIFVLEERPLLEERRGLPAWPYSPSHWLKVFSTSDVSLQRQIELPLADCHWLAASRDGKYLYAVGPDHGPPFSELSVERTKLAVIAVATGREVKVINAGQHPAIVLPVSAG